MITLTISLFCLIVFFALFSPKKKWIYGISVFLVILLILVAGFRNGESVLDYDVYLVMFDTIKNGKNILVEPSFIFLVSLVKSSMWLFVVYAFIGVVLKCMAIKQLTDLFLLSLTVYCSYFFILHEMTQIRAGVAAGFLLLCIKPLYEKKWTPFFIFLCLAIFFHYSAFIILLMIFLGNKPYKKLLLYSIPIAYILYFSGVNLVVVLPIPGIQEKIAIYQTIQETGDDAWSNINVFNLVYLSKIAIFYFLIWNYNQLEKCNKYFPLLMKIYCVSLFSFVAFATMPVIAFRINELLGVVEIILIPFLYYIFKPKSIAKTVVVSISGILLLISIFYNNYIH